MQVIEIVGLHDHVVELEEGKAALHALLVAFRAQHIVDAEVRAHFAQHIHVFQIQQPIGVVHHNGFILAEFNEAADLLFEAIAVVLDDFGREHRAHIGASAGVADHARAATEQHDGLVARHLQTFHQAQRHEVTHVQRISRRVKANIEARAAVIDQIFYLFFVGHLSNQATTLEFFVNTHNNPSLSTIGSSVRWFRRAADA